MIMTKSDIRKNIAEIRDIFEFDYNGKSGNVDPCYNSQLKRDEFLLCFDGKELVVYSIDDVMNTPFIDSKSLNDVAKTINITAY